VPILVKETPGGTPVKTRDGLSGEKIQILSVGAHVRTYKGIESITVTGTAGILTVPLGATHADILAEGAASTDFIRYWHGGNNPTSTIGKKLKDHEEIISADPSSFRHILGSGSGTVVLRIEYYAYE